METSLFNYNLPKERIAQFPPKIRGTTNLLVLNRKDKSIKHKKYSDILYYLSKGDVLVLNNTKVEKVRTYLYTKKDGKRECIFLNKVFLGNNDGFEYREAMFSIAKKIKQGEILKDKQTNIEIEVVKKIRDGIFLVRSKDGNIDRIIEKSGHTPLPQYIKRDDNSEDIKRYNTIYAKCTGSAASPTAGLNMTEELIEKIKEKGVSVVGVTLNVGWGTFAPIREGNIEEHKLHSEEIEISKDVSEIINKCIDDCGKVFALGTTSTRTLESCAFKNGEKYYIKPFKGETNLYIYPGYEWKIVNGLITNFHAPYSSLLTLVSSFAGHALMIEGYEEALNKKYNFLSYGDSMIIL